jgi:hypothetical protein
MEKHWTLVIATVVYCGTTLLGVIAFTRGVHFGKLHHVFFAACCCSCLLCVLNAPSPLLVLQLLILALLPFTRGGSQAHRTLALVGLATWIGVWVT